MDKRKNPLQHFQFFSKGLSLHRGNINIMALTKVYWRTKHRIFAHQPIIWFYRCKKINKYLFRPS